MYFQLFPHYNEYMKGSNFVWFLMTTQHASGVLQVFQYVLNTFLHYLYKYLYLRSVPKNFQQRMAMIENILLIPVVAYFNPLIFHSPLPLM